MSSPPVKDAIILKGWNHLTRSLSQTLPTQMLKAHTARRAAMQRLRSGKS
jgi:hypothetical protein